MSGSLRTTRIVACWLALTLPLMPGRASANEVVDSARQAAIVGDEVFFEIDGAAFLVPLGALRYPSALRAPIARFYFEVPIAGVNGPFIALGAVSGRYWLARNYPRTVLNRLVGETVKGEAGDGDDGSDEGDGSFTSDGARQPGQQGLQHQWQAARAEDWFILRDHQQLVRTLIRCDAGDGSPAPVANGRGQAEGAPAPVPFCTHDANLDPQRGELLRLYYPRSYLGAWRAIQHQVEQWLEQYKDRGQQTAMQLGSQRP